MAIELELEGKIGALVTSLEKISKDLTGIQAQYDGLNKDGRTVFNEAAKGADNYADNLEDVNEDLDKNLNVTAAIQKRITTLQKLLSKTYDPALIRKYSGEIAKYKTTLDSVNANKLKAVTTEATAGQKAFSKLNSTIAATFAGLSVGFAFNVVVTEIREFEKAVDELQAITGATGETLDFLQEKAIQTGMETTASALETVQAYKLIASAKPELLENADALAKITEEAIALSDASGLDLPQAATALTDALNQFNASADQAGKFINVLAAGAKFGAVEIPQATEALLGFGAVAKNANVSIEESVALIEALGEKGIKGAEAGTALRNVLLRLSATEALPKEAQEAFTKAGVDMKVLSDNTLTLEQRLKELSKIQGDMNALVNIFGKENATAAQILLDQTQRVTELTASVTGTSTAYEQAAINTDNFQSLVDKLNNKWKALILSFDSGNGIIIGTFKDAIGGINGFIDALIELNKPENREQLERYIQIFTAITKVLGVTVAGYIAYSAAVKGYQLLIKAGIVLEKGYTVAKIAGAGAQALLTGNTVRATAAMRALNIVTKQSPLFLIGTALTLAYTAWEAFSDNTEEATKATRDFTAEVDKEQSELNSLFEILKSTAVGSKERAEAIKAINSQYGEYLPSLLTEKSTLQEIEIAQEAANRALIKNIAIKAQQAEINETVTKQIAAQKAAQEALTTTLDESGKTSALLGTASAGFGELTSAATKYFETLDREAAVVTADGLIFPELDKQFTEFSDRYGIAKDKVQELVLDVVAANGATKSQIQKITEFYKGFIGELDKDSQRTGTTKTTSKLVVSQSDLDKISKLRLDAMQEGLDKELAIEKFRFNALKKDLDKHNIDTQEATFQHLVNLQSIKLKFYQDDLTNQQLTDRERILQAQKTALEEVRIIEDSLLLQGQLTEEQQKQLKVLRASINRGTAEQLFELDKRDLQLTQQLAEHKLNEKRDLFETEKEFELFKQEELLKIKIEFAQKELDLLSGKEGLEFDVRRAELNGFIKTARAQLKDLQASNKGKEFSIWKLVGLNPDDPQDQQMIQALNTAVSSVKSSFDQIIQSQIQATQELLRAKDEQLTSLESQLDEELRLNEEGSANNVDNLRKQIAVTKKEREKALRDAEKAKKAQQAIDTTTQISSLVTASAAIFKALAPYNAIPGLGVALAVGVIGAMVAAFVASKVKASQASKSLAKGGTGVVKGKRHSGGGENFDDHIEIEDGERWSVFSRKSSSKHGSLIAAFTKAINADRPDVIAKLLNGTGVTFNGEKVNPTIERNLSEARKEQMKMSIDLQDASLKENNELLRKYLIAQQSEEKITDFGDYIIIKKGNHTRKIKK